MARRKRDLAGLAALGALGMYMARGAKRGADEAEPPVENRGGMVSPAAAAASPAAAASDTRDYSREIAEHEGGIGLTVPDSAPAAPAPGRPANRQMPAASRPAPVSYSAAEAATDLARESSRGVKPTATPAASSRGLTLGTPTRPAPGTPSIYAGPEAWAEYRRRQAAGMKKGGAVKKMASGGSVSSASKRGDGIAQRGKTRGRMI